MLRPEFASRVTLKCQACGTSHTANRPLWACPCGGILDVLMRARFPKESMALRAPGLWRYREALPVALNTPPISLGEPQTPLVAVALGAYRVYLKLDFLFPTGSFKARGAAVLLTKARELGVTSLVEDSSGNAGAAIAAYAAAAGVKATIYVPARAARAKTAQIALYGAQIKVVAGSRADVADAALLAARSQYYASHAWNPFFLEGTQTIAFEIWEQLDGRVPDMVISPVGHGTMLLGLAKGFDSLRRAGMTTHVPRLIGVQAAACAPLRQAFRQGGSELSPVQPGPTQADGIAIGRPLRWRQILQAVSDSGGDIVAVGEDAIARSMSYWARRGLLMEPTSATATAVLEDFAASNRLQPEQVVVVPITGSGMKSAVSNTEVVVGDGS